MNDNFFKYIKSNHRIKIKYPNRYKLATKENIAELNDYSQIISTIAKFYDEELSNSKIDYVYKDSNGIKVLPVKFLRENFPHLTGINFANKTALEKFNYLKEGNNDSPIIIERDGLTIKKLKVIDKLPNILKANSFTLTELNKVKQAQRLNFSKGILHSEVLLALHNFKPEFYQPRSLLNISKSKQYNKVNKNTVLGIFREQIIPNGIHIEPISLNSNALDNIAITTEMLIGMKKYADDLGKQLKRKQKLNLTKGEKQMNNIDNLKEKVENYPVIVDEYASENDSAYLMKLKDRANELNMSIVKGSEIKNINRENSDSIYLIRKGMNPIKLGSSLSDIIDSITTNGNLDGNRVTTLPISLTESGNIPNESEIKKQFVDYADSVNKIANDKQYFGQQSINSKKYLEGVNGSYAVQNNDGKWEIHPARQGLNGQIEGEWGYALKDINSLDKLDSSTPIYATSDKAKDVYTKEAFQKSSQKILEDSNSQKNAHFPIDDRSINLMTKNELKYAINSGTSLESIEEEITNDISDNFNAYSDITEGRWGLVKRSYVDNLTAQTQMIDFYTYDPNQNKKPKLIANDLQDLKFKLDNDQIKNDISIKENKRVNPQEYEMYLKNHNIYMNPSREDFEIANENAGKDKNSNLKGITNTPQTENELNRIYAKEFLKENGLEDSQKNISSVAKNLAWNREYNQAWNKSNPTKPQKDTSAKAAYLEENTIFKNPEFKSEYISNYGKKTSNIRHQKVSKSFKNMSSNQDLDM